MVTTFVASDVFAGMEGSTERIEYVRGDVDSDGSELFQVHFEGCGRGLFS
jgi:hypothetical protein